MDGSSRLSTPSSGWRVLDLPEEGAGSLLSTIGTGSIRAGYHTEKETECVVRELAQALARSVASISRGNSRECSRDGSPVRAAQAGADSHGGEEELEVKKRKDEAERCARLVLELQQQARRRLRELDRLKANKGAGATLYNPSAYQPRGAALSNKVTNINPFVRPKSIRSTCKGPGAKKGNLAAWRHELELLEADLKTLSSRMEELHEKKTEQNTKWEENLKLREKAIASFQTKEFIDFALASAQTAQQISNKEEELRAEEELLNQEKQIMMQNLQEMKQIRADLDVQHRSVESTQRLDVPTGLREPCSNEKAEQLRVWEVNLCAREHEAEKREIDIARKLLDIQERERLVEVKYLTVQELRAQIHEEFSAWEDDLVRKECHSAAEATRCGNDRDHLGHQNYFEMPRTDLQDGCKRQQHHVSRATELNALDVSLQGKENSRLAPNWRDWR